MHQNSWNERCKSYNNLILCGEVLKSEFSILKGRATILGLLMFGAEGKEGV